MKSTGTGAVSGCIIWVISLGVLALCLLPIAILIGSITSFSSYAIDTTGRYLCPEGSTPRQYSYETTRVDDFGNTQPSTAYELHCVDGNGTVVKEDPIVYAFLWIGVFALIGLILSGVLAFALAAPTGILIGRLLSRRSKPDAAANIEPQ